MKFLVTLIIFTLCVMLIEDASGQGSPAANAGAFLTLYKERKKMREQQALQQANRGKPQQRLSYYNPGFYFK
jgi:hypothetical protein